MTTANQIDNLIQEVRDQLNESTLTVDEHIQEVRNQLNETKPKEYDIEKEFARMIGEEEKHIEDLQYALLSAQNRINDINECLQDVRNNKLELERLRNERKAIEEM